MELCSHKHTSHIEVRYSETDQMGIVHHAVYPIWFEQARLEFFKSLGSSYVEIEAQGYACPVLELTVRYRNSTHFGETVDIDTTLERKGKYHFKFTYKLSVEGKLCATGTSEHCFLENGKPTPDLPEQVKLLFPNG